ncbi:hypothetical protein BJ742DRAFT_46154 [Cladochytrium replicatum]|nr:hypothetical protein BJ742DRAFT_46154 [Cladochytrium replicatum]
MTALSTRPRYRSSRSPLQPGVQQAHRRVQLTIQTKVISWVPPDMVVPRPPFPPRFPGRPFSESDESDKVTPSSSTDTRPQTTQTQTTKTPMRTTSSPDLSSAETRSSRSPTQRLPKIFMEPRRTMETTTTPTRSSLLRSSRLTIDRRTSTAPYPPSSLRTRPPFFRSP